MYPFPRVIQFNIYDEQLCSLLQNHVDAHDGSHNKRPKRAISLHARVDGLNVVVGAREKLFSNPAPFFGYAGKLDALVSEREIPTRPFAG